MDADETIVPGDGPAARHGMPERPGDEVGPYKLMSMLGEGAFGTVWLAERRRPFLQQVALKVVKLGMDSRSVVARFEQERQALAVMNHPHVARVIDGGLTARGSPYFAMEFVKGEPITKFCDRHRLSIEQRLRIFVQVCDAVQHAHTKGIIHRDLKPTNILVSGGDGASGQAKVIDFGVAKALTQRMSEHTIFTETGQMIGTPEYMSPEQAEPDANDIDTRSDVYGLGVVLYELLAGAPPFEPGELRRRPLREIQRIIRDDEPSAPSAKLSAIAAGDAAAAARIAECRQGAVDEIVRRLRAELEWIPLKAIRKDRQRRYPSAESLGADVRRYLEGRPLEAAPERRSYRLRKFVRRNRVQALATAAVTAAVVAGLVATMWQARRANERAIAAERAERAEKERADQLKELSDFQSRMLGQIDTTTSGVELLRDIRNRHRASLEMAGVPAAERDRRADALQQELARVNSTDTAAAMIDRALLKPAIKAIDAQLRITPAADANLRQALADRYRSIALLDEAMPLQRAALEIRRRELGESHRDTIESVRAMGLLLQSQGQFDEAERFLRDALGKRLRLLGEDDPDTLASSDDLGALLQARGKLEDAEPHLRNAVERRRRVLGEDHPDTLKSLRNLAYLLYAGGRVDEAVLLIREEFDRSRRVLGEDHPDTIGSATAMGYLLRSQDRPGEAEPYFRQALEKSRRVFGEDHPDTLAAMDNLGRLLESRGDLDGAELLYREALQKSRRLRGEEHPDTVIFRRDLGDLLQVRGRFGEAETSMRENLEISRRTLGADHPETIGVMISLGSLCIAQSRFPEGETLCREALERSRRIDGADGSPALVAASLLARAMLAQGRAGESLELLAPLEPTARNEFAGQYAERLARLLTVLGRARAGAGFDAERFALAEANLLEAHPILVASVNVGPGHPDTLACAQGLVDLYAAWDKSAPGRGYAEKSAEWKAKLDAADARPGASAPAGR